MASEEILLLIDNIVGRYQGTTDPVAAVRRQALLSMREQVDRYGFDAPNDVKLEGCLMPYIAQELNYDDFDWSNRLASLGHLESMVEIDVVVWSRGRRRSELSDAEYASYLDFCHRAIDLRRRR